MPDKKMISSPGLSWTLPVHAGVSGTFIPLLQPLYSIQYNRVWCKKSSRPSVKIDPHGNIQAPLRFIDVMEREHAYWSHNWTSQCRGKPAELIRMETGMAGYCSSINVNFSRNTG